LFTDELAKEYSDKKKSSLSLTNYLTCILPDILPRYPDLLFLSDIRTASHTDMSNEEAKERLEWDNSAQVYTQYPGNDLGMTHMQSQRIFDLFYVFSFDAWTASMA